MKPTMAAPTIHPLLLPVLCLAILASAADATDPVDTVRLEIPHTTRVGQKLYRNAPWLFGVDLKNVIDGQHEWFSLVKDKGDHHLQVNGYLYRLAGQVLHLELLNSETHELTRLLRIFIVPPPSAPVNPAEPPALKYLADAQPPQPSLSPPSLPPPPPPSIREVNRESARSLFLARMKRQSSSSPTVLQMKETVAPGSLLFAAVSPISPVERYAFKIPPPNELDIDPITSNVYLRMDKELNFADMPTIPFSVLVLTSDGRGLFRVLDYQLQVLKGDELSPIISRYSTLAWTVLYRETATMDGAMVYQIQATTPRADTNLTYEFIPGMEGRSEGRFRVVPDLGLVVTMKNDGYPALRNYDLGVRAVNPRSSTPLTRYGYSYVRVFTSYQPPQFSQDTYTFYVLEELDPPVKVGQILCQSINNMWSVVSLSAKMSTSAASVLTIDTNGAVFTKVRLDYDVPTSPKVYFFSVVCTENATSPTPRTAGVEVAVQLVDTNDNRPYFNIEYFVKSTLTREDLPVGSEVFRVSALDSDAPENALLVYALTGSGSELFNVTRDPVSRDAVLALTSPMDYEALPSGGKQYKFIITVSDGVVGSSVRPSAFVVINVQNVNDNPPTIRNFTSSVDKNTVPSTNVVQIQVWDQDGSGINYYFRSSSNSTTSQYPSASNNLFTMDQITGMVSIGSASLFSLRDASYIIPFVAIDDGTCDGCPIGTPLMSDIGYLILTVTDSSSVAPVFVNCPTGTVDYTEAAAIGTQLMTIIATDPRSTGATIEYAILPNTLMPNPDAYFAINSTSGLITATSVINIDIIPVVTLRNYFWLTVRAVNLFNRLSSYCSFQLSFVDINDEVPMFDSDANIIRVIDLATPPGTAIGQINAFDPDVPDSPLSTIQYVIVGSVPPAGSSLFDITSAQNLGTVVTRSNFAGYTDRTKFVLTVEAINPVPITGPAKPWNQMTFTVWLTSTRRLLPPIVSTDPPNYVILLNETVSPSTLVIAMTASSPEGPGTTRTYEWSEPTRANYVPTNAAFELHFGLRGATTTACTSDICGVATVGQFDFQNYKYFYARTRISYKERDATIGEIYTEVYKMIGIQDMNNRWPEFITRQYVTTVFAIENSTFGTMVTQAFAVDLDSLPLYRKVVYSLDQTVSPDYVFFSIDSNTGVLRTAAPPSAFDAESNKTTFDLQVNASDSFQSSLTGVIGPNAKTLRLSVSTRDINDNPPSFPRSFYQFNIREDTPIDSTVGIINATDPDVSDKLRYNIESGDPKFQFMSVVQTGEFKVAKALDFHQISSYSLVFVATDGKNVAKTQVNITLTDVNNHAPVFTSLIFNITNVTESDPAGPIYTLTAKDKDSAVLTYSLSGRWASAPTNYFSVDPNTGVLSTTKPLDREESPVLRFNALVSDGGMLGYAEINVWPNDLNDNRPLWNETSLFGVLWDNSSVGTPFMQLSVIDPDITGTITYTLVANSTNTAEYVTVSPAGMVATTAALGVADRERLPPKAPWGIFSFVVTATDGVGSPITGTATVRIADINDNPPVFDKATYSVIIPETTELNDTVFTAGAIDVDDVDFGRLNYTLPDKSDYFNILNIPFINGGSIILVKKLDYDDPTIPRSFVLRIIVTDSAPQSHSTTCTVSISVLDINDNAPQIFLSGASFTRQEGPASLGFLVAFTANDTDPTDAVLAFSIQPESDPYGNLALTGVTGTSANIVVQNALDREAWGPASTDDAVHMYVILASDQRGLTGTATLTVTITDINDSPPTLTLPSTVTIMENSAIGTVAQPGGLGAEDKDRAVNGPPFTFAQDMSAGNNWTEKFSLVVSGNTFSIRSAKVFDRETDGKQFLLRVLITDRGGLQGTGTVTVIIGDVDDNPMLSNGYKQVYVYIFEGNENYWFNASTRMSLGFAAVADKDDWDRSLKSYTWTNPNKYFEMASYGEVLVKGGTPANNYSINVEVRDPAGNLAYCQMVVTITVLPRDAVESSGSMVLDNMDVATFVERVIIPGSYTLVKDAYPDYSFSPYDYFKLNLSAVLNTTFNKVHIFYVNEMPESRSILIRYTALGSPFYFSSRLASLVALNKDIFMRTLASYGSTLRMVPLDYCRLETDGVPLCRTGCLNTMVVAGKDAISDIYNSTALVGINANIIKECGCGAETFVPPTVCTYGTCLHDGNCTDIPGSYSYTCSCPAGHEGPRCEKLNAGFLTDASFLVLPSFPGACANLHLSFYFLTAQSAPNVLLFYTGVNNLTTTPLSPDRDFLALELVNGRPKVTIDLGAGPSVGGLHMSPTAPALNDSNWHRIDIFLRNQTIVLKVDQCLTAPTVLDGDPAPPNLTSCQAYWTVPGNFSKLNVASFPVFLGGRYNMGNPALYPTGLAPTGFIGEIAKLRFNRRLYDLYVGPRTWYAPGTTGNFSPTLPSCSWTDGVSKCQNGWCWGIMNGAVGSGVCMCYSGYRLDNNGRCTIPLDVVELKTSSYMFYKMRPPLFATVANVTQSIKIEIQFRTRYTNGTLMFVSGNDPYRPEHMELAVRDSRLVYRHNLGDYVYRDLVLPNANVSDGAWHWVMITRRLTDVEVIMDHGEFYNYGYMFGNYTSTYNNIVLSDLVAVGAIVKLSASTTSIEPASSDLRDTCVSTVRINEAYFPVLTTANSDGATMASLDYSVNVISGCASGVACPVGVTCPATMVCLPAWRPLSPPVCGCPATYILYSGVCYAAAGCLYNNPCVNGICSLVGGLPKCTCNAGWQGDTCAAAIFAVGSASLIIILVLLGFFVLLLVAFLLWYCCFAGGKKEPLLIDVPYENVVEYNEEGGGQEDKLNFDMAALRIMVTDTTIVQERVTALQTTRTDFHSLLQTRLALANSGPDPSPFDGVLDYEYEGRGAKADDLDSIVSGDDNTTQNFDFLQTWGPKFERITTIYMTFPDNADDLQSVSEFAGPSSGAQGNYSVTTTTTTTRRV